MRGLFDLEYHEKKIKEYQPPLAKLYLVPPEKPNKAPILGTLKVK